MIKEKSISVVVPCYNEEKNIDGMSMRQQYISNSRIKNNLKQNINLSFYL